MNETQNALAEDPYHACILRLQARLRGLTTGAVLEIGSRNRSGIIRRDFVPQGVRYVGLDIVAGENVDIIGDAHSLSSYFPAGTFSVIFSMSTFEHLLMPWKVVVEMNHVLQLDGEVFVTSHQTWPLHEEPWDFWRFSAHTWKALFNQFTGFEVIEVAMGERASIVPAVIHPAVNGLDAQPSFLGCAVRARKIGLPRVRWDAEVGAILNTSYPH